MLNAQNERNGNKFTHYFEQLLKWHTLKTWLVITPLNKSKSLTRLNFHLLHYGMPCLIQWEIKKNYSLKNSELEGKSTGWWYAGWTKAKEIHYSRDRKCISFGGKRVGSIVFSLWIIISLQLRLTCWNENGTSSKAGTSYSRMVILRKGVQCSRLKSFSIKGGK